MGPRSHFTTMSSQGEVTLPAARRTRKSIGGGGRSPSRKASEKENATIDMGSAGGIGAGRKKSRSKSIGPGGLDVLKSGTGNRRAVCTVNNNMHRDVMGLSLINLASYSVSCCAVTTSSAIYSQTNHAFTPRYPTTSTSFITWSRS